MPVGKTLRIELLSPGLVHWSDDLWHSTHDVETRDSGLGIHYADLATRQLESGRQVVFTFYWPQAGHWEGTDYMVTVEPQAS